MAFLGWSSLEAVVALFLDSLSVVLCLAGVGSWQVTRQMAHGEEDLLDRVNLVAGAIVLFAIVGGLLAFALAVFGFFVWTLVLRATNVDPLGLLAEPTMWRSFGLMMAFQLPRFVELVAHHTPESAQQIVQPAVGLVLYRLALVAMAAGLLGLLPGEAALVALVVVAQSALAAGEIFGTRLLPPAEDGRPPRRRPIGARQTRRR